MTLQWLFTFRRRLPFIGCGLELPSLSMTVLSCWVVRYTVKLQFSTTPVYDVTLMVGVGGGALAASPPFFIPPSGPHLFLISNYVIQMEGKSSLLPAEGTSFRIFSSAQYANLGGKSVFTSYCPHAHAQTASVRDSPYFTSPPFRLKIKCHTKGLRWGHSSSLMHILMVNWSLIGHLC